MEHVSPDLVEQFVAAARAAGQRGLLRCSSGNLSWRIGPNRMLVSATRSWLGRLTANDVVLCAIDPWEVLNERKPTVEFRMHNGIMKARPDINVVLHFQTPFATLLACRTGTPPNYFVLPEIPAYVGRVATVPFIMPGTADLAGAVTAAMRGHDMVVMRQHGHVVAARDFDHAIQNAEFFELACQIIVQGGPQVDPLPEERVQELLAQRSYG